MDCHSKSKNWHESRKGLNIMQMLNLTLTLCRSVIQKIHIYNKEARPVLVNDDVRENKTINKLIFNRLIKSSTWSTFVKISSTCWFKLSTGHIGSFVSCGLTTGPSSTNPFAISICNIMVKQFRDAVGGNQIQIPQWNKKSSGFYIYIKWINYDSILQQAYSHLHYRVIGLLKFGKKKKRLNIQAKDQSEQITAHKQELNDYNMHRIIVFHLTRLFAVPCDWTFANYSQSNFSLFRCHTQTLCFCFPTGITI